jgi:hypothetical protein
MSGLHFRHGPLTVSSTTLLFVFLFLQTTAVAADQVAATAPAPDLATLIQRLTQAELENRARARPYSLTREYKVFGADGERPRTDVVATVNFLPPNMKSYDIAQSTGGIGEKVIRHILDREIDAARDPTAMLITEQNYDFSFAGEDVVAGRPVYRLNITPKHPRKDLLKATIWVDKDSYRILRIEGDPVRSPSFWVRDIHLILEFGEVEGMWMQTEVHALARMRFGGEYQVTSQNLNYDVARAVAANPRSASLSMPRRRHSSAVMAADVR